MNLLTNQSACPKTLSLEPNNLLSTRVLGIVDATCFETFMLSCFLD